MTKDSHPLAPVSDLLGSWRRFGPAGPVYRVVGLSRETADVEIEILETGETLAYDALKAALDPIES